MGLALCLITVLALFGSVSSVIIAQTLRGEAAVINQSCALRILTYAASTELLQPSLEDSASHQLRLEQALDRFEQKLNGAVLTRTMPVNPTDTVRQAFDEIAANWSGNIRPGIVQLSHKPPSPEEFLSLRQKLDTFVTDIVLRGNH